MEEIRTGIIGIGNMGFAHASCIYAGRIKGMRLAALCDIDGEKLRAARGEFDGVRLFDSAGELFASGLADAVIIAVPHRLHGKLAEAAFEAGLHVMTEKPSDISVGAARRMNEAAKKSGRVFGIMFNQRTNPLYRRARELVRGGSLGELKRSVWIVTNWYRTQGYYDSGGWRATWAGEGGGVLINQAPHNLDLWQWICGMPCAVTAFCDTARYHNIEVEDDAEIFARYANGATGIFVASTGEYPGTNRLEVSGTRGKLVVENGLLKLWENDVDEREMCYNTEINPDGVTVRYSEYSPDAPETAHMGVLQSFADCILKGSPLIADGSEGINSLELSNAAYLSEWMGNKEIRLPLCAEEFDEYLRRRAEGSSFSEGSGGARLDGEYKKRWQVRW
ncbi:MAG: Gfo/Idh/MocA family oxidoreductase [Butyrivibrio sp.]|nr:Gfo/Idh/MocA family oxidoreductase [Butyrivibrio sp.]